MEDILNIVGLVFQYLIVFYCIGILFSYIFIGFISALEVLHYKRKRDVTNYEEIISSPFAPGISIIAPAYNESVTIVDNIRSLLSLHYSKLTVIVVNDGSKDDTLQVAIKAYDLERVEYAYNSIISTKHVRGIYKSKNKAFKKLIVVDKENGGKADAINVGMNISESDYFACIDVDCIIEQDAFLKMVKPIMEAEEERIIAVGGIVWLTNGSDIENGKLIKVKAPNTFVPSIQIIEYFRAFLLGRTAWSKINGLLLISGAFGLFDTEIARLSGGYNHATVGEDMELVMRMHKHMLNQKAPYKISYIPEPLCWTEAPSGYDVLSRQRNRWTRGTIECLLMHKDMFFNPKYKVLGMISYPYWLFAEWMAPFVEFLGLIFFAVMAIIGLVNWPFFTALILLVYTLAIFISSFSILVQDLSYACFRSPKDILKLFITALKEPILYHPRTVYWSIKGNYDFFTGKNKGWGEMTRSGFTKK